MKLLLAFLCLMTTVYTTSVFAQQPQGSFLGTKIFADKKLSLQKWNYLKSRLTTQEGAEFKFIDQIQDNTKRMHFFAASPIGILIGTEDIKKEENGNIATDMWHFVAHVDDGTRVRFLRRIVVKDSGNGILSIQDLEVTDSENENKFEQLKVELYKRIWKLPWLRK